MIEPNLASKAEVLETIEALLKEKEKLNFFSQGTVSFISLSYKYIELMKKKRDDFEGTLYHVVALTIYPQKELLLLIFQKYKELDAAIVSTDTLQYSEPLINTILSEVITLKKYSLAFAVTEVHRLLVQELEEFFVQKVDIEQDRVIYLIDKITRSRKIQKGIRDNYKKIKESIIKFN